MYEIKNIEYENAYVIDCGALGGFGWLSTYLFVGTEAYALVDPGPAVVSECILNVIKDMELLKKRGYLILTHIHIDHAGSVGTIVKKLKNVMVVTHPKGFKHLVNPQKLMMSSKEVLGNLAMEFGEVEPTAEDKIITLKDCDSVFLGGINLKAYYTPGHASHHISYLVEPFNLLLAGDSIANYFNGISYPITVPPFNFEKYLDSLNKMKALNPRKIGVSHFGLVDEPQTFIQKAEGKVLTWVKTVEELFKKGLTNVSEIYEEILKLDADLAAVKALEEKLKPLKGSTLRAVIGIYEYVLSKKGEYRT